MPRNTAECRTRGYWLYVTLHPQVSPLFPLCPGMLAPLAPRIYLPWAKSLEKSTSQCNRGHLVSDKFYHLSRCFFRYTTSNSEPPPSRDLRMRCARYHHLRHRESLRNYNCPVRFSPVASPDSLASLLPINAAVYGIPFAGLPAKRYTPCVLHRRSCRH